MVATWLSAGDAIYSPYNRIEILPEAGGDLAMGFIAKGAAPGAAAASAST